jgi:hypothetical protein
MEADDRNAVTASITKCVDKEMIQEDHAISGAQYDWILHHLSSLKIAIAVPAAGGASSPVALALSSLIGIPM